MTLVNLCLSRINDLLLERHTTHSFGTKWIRAVRKILFHPPNTIAIKTTVEILGFLCLAAKENREELCKEPRTIPFLLSILGKNFEIGWAKPDTNLQDRVLTLLYILSENHSSANDVVSTLMRNIILIAPGLSRPSGQVDTLCILHRLTQNKKYLEAFADLHLEANHGVMTLVNHTVHILRMYCNILPTVGCEAIRIPSKPVQLVEISQAILLNCSNHPQLLSQIVSALTAYRNTEMAGRKVFLPIYSIEKLESLGYFRMVKGSYDACYNHAIDLVRITMRFPEVKRLVESQHRSFLNEHLDPADVDGIRVLPFGGLTRQLLTILCCWPVK